MKTPILKLTQRRDGWQAEFAFQVIQLSFRDWVKLKWGFNASALLDEALDRYRLFIESQAVIESESQTDSVLSDTLVMRGVNDSPESGLRMLLLGKSIANTREQAQKRAVRFSRHVYSTFPYDFSLIPIETEDTFRQLCGDELLGKNLCIAQVQRRKLLIPTTKGSYEIRGMWQSTPLSNQQIWRSLFATSGPALFNILIRPSSLSGNERHTLLELKTGITNLRQGEEFSGYVPWAEYYVKRRLAPEKRYFIVQINLVADEADIVNLAHSVGSALTRDSYELTTPGYHASYPSSEIETTQWRTNLRLLEPTKGSSRLDDIADRDEVFSVFRFPYAVPEDGLPNTIFAGTK
jgi:hypothetical protein